MLKREFQYFYLLIIVVILYEMFHTCLYESFRVINLNGILILA